jgi:hypothetical protein
MLSTEEISIRLGVDSKAVGSGMASASSLIDKNLGGFKKKFSKFSGDILSGSVMGFFGSVTNSVTDLIKVGVDKLSDYISKTMYDTISGISDRLIEVTSRMHAESNTAGRTHENTAAEMDRLDAEEARRIFEAKSAEDRKTESAAKLTATNEELTAAKKAVEQAREDIKELRRLNKDNQLAASEGAKKIAEAEANVLKVRKENIQATKDYRQALKDIDSKVPKVEAPVSMPDNPHTTGSLVESPKTRDAMMQGIADYYSQIASDRQKYGLTSESEKFRAMSDSLYEAQKAASEEFVQKVSIVEIKE